LVHHTEEKVDNPHKRFLLGRRREGVIEPTRLSKGEPENVAGPGWPRGRRPGWGADREKGMGDRKRAVYENSLQSGQKARGKKAFETVGATQMSKGSNDGGLGPRGKGKSPGS